MNKRKSYRLLCCLLLMLMSFGSKAQERPSSRMVLFGVGGSNQYDTYLSPSDYKGPSLSILYETDRQLLRNEHVAYQSQITGIFANTDNSAETANQMAGDFTYTSTWFRQWSPLWKDLTLMAGGQVRAHVGFLYNTRNSNNPAQGYADVQGALSVMARQGFRIRHQHLQVQYQASLPLIGGMFSPRYGQSYYNIFSQGNYDHNVVCTHPGNALSISQLLTVSIPVRHARVNVGYYSDLRQAKVNGLRQHHYTRSLMLGFTREIKIRRD